MSIKAKANMWSDLHTHCLPGIDDGAADLDTSLQLLRMLSSQGVGSAALTSHFYPHRESLSSFLQRREQAFGLLAPYRGEPGIPALFLGAEIYLIQDLCRIDLRPLCIQGTNLLLLELPRQPYKPWILDELQNIAYAWDVEPVLAHIERYAAWYGPREYRQLLAFDELILQFNTSSLLLRGDYKRVCKLAAGNHRLALGSDCHNLAKRAPCFDQALELLEHSRKGRDILSRLLPFGELAGA